MNWMMNDRVNDQHKDIVKKILYYGGYYSLYEHLHMPSENRLLILMYHSVVQDDDQRSQWFRWNTPTRTQFEAVLTTLKKYYRVISVEDAVREIKSTGALKERSAAITFDDGYLSAYEVVFPLLKKHGVSATVYLPTDWIDGRLNPWWMVLTHMIDQCHVTSDTVAKIGKIIGTSVDLKVNKLRAPADSRRMILASVERVLMHQNDTTRDEILQELRNSLFEGQEFASRTEEPMTWEQIGEMAAHGIRFGAHTCSHPNLSHVDLETAEREIVESKRIIEGRLGAEVSGFAYPYGYDVDGYRRFRPILEKHGFHYACTSWCGHVDSTSDPYLLGRIGLPLSTSNAIIARTLSLEYCAKP
jgi:peptidoglycan/xylan/chitin deacetylase (PgdA/CDA1 family)